MKLFKLGGMSQKCSRLKYVNSYHVVFLKSFVASKTMVKTTDLTSPGSSTDDDAVKKFCKDQRWPAFYEPVCVMCGKFGEYICDETDEDVCSLECKAAHLLSRRTVTESIASHGEDVKTSKTMKSFDCYYKDCVVFTPDKSVACVSDEKMNFFREKLEIKINGINIPNLIMDFNQCGFTEKLLSNLKDNNFISPTPVQMQVIPLGMCGHDVLVSAATSSGKTASFLLPVIQIIYNCVGR